jgi:hypothetical protein
MKFSHHSYAVLLLLPPLVHLLLLLLQVGEEDYNFDGKPDMIRFVAAVQSPIPVHSLKLLLQFSYATQVRLMAETGRHLQEATLLLA